MTAQLVDKSPFDYEGEIPPHLTRAYALPMALVSLEEFEHSFEVGRLEGLLIDLPAGLNVSGETKGLRASRARRPLERVCTCVRHPAAVAAEWYPRERVRANA